MYRVVICDDEQTFSDMQEEVCRAILDKMDIEYQISVFASSAKFMDAFTEQPEKFDLILLDIVMNGVDGIELAKRIRQKSEDVEIIFITSYQDYVFQGYDVNACGYLMKPVDKQKLEQLIVKAYEKQFKENMLITQLSHTDSAEKR